MPATKERSAGILHVRIPKFLRAWVLAKCQARGIHPAAYIAALIVADKARKDGKA